VTLRLLAAVALAAALVLLLAYRHLLGQGPFASVEARHLRDMKERTAMPAAFTPWTFTDFTALPHAAPLTRYASIEQRGVSLEGYVTGMLHASDGDVHLEIGAVPRIGGVDAQYVTGEITPAVRAAHPAWTYERLRQDFRPLTSPPFDRAPARVRISGWLLYDFQYDGLPDTSDALRAVWNKTNPTLHHASRVSIWPRLTGWEIHPVTRVEVWDDSLGWRRLGA